mmetsp:Transcript_51697/g.102821  ORF Transcript_51697/g.102821 Transcript_51697/m.102821 type:complete len:135 (-) Transcript_51697:192-596(-)
MQNIRCQSVQEACEIQELQYLKTILAAQLATFEATRHPNRGHNCVQQKGVDELQAISGAREGARMVIKGGPAYIVCCQNKANDTLQQNQPKTAKDNPADYHSQSDVLLGASGHDIDRDVLMQLKAKLAMRLAQF